MNATRSDHGQMKFRKLRIAFSVGCILLCLLLIALWVRSYSREDTLFGVVGPERIQLTSSYGKVRIFVSPKNMFSVPPKWDYARFVARRPPSGEPLLVFRRMHQPPFGVMLVAPHSMLLATVGLLIAIPWLPWTTRFSLRTLLIAMTVLAVLLGAVVWAVK